MAMLEDGLMVKKTIISQNGGNDMEKICLPSREGQNYIAGHGKGLLPNNNQS